jgi:hypothetical protein
VQKLYDVLFAAGIEVIHAKHVVAFRNQPLA